MPLGEAEDTDSVSCDCRAPTCQSTTTLPFYVDLWLHTLAVAETHETLQTWPKTYGVVSVGSQATITTKDWADVPKAATEVPIIGTDTTGQPNAPVSDNASSPSM